MNFMNRLHIQPTTREEYRRLIRQRQPEEYKLASEMSEDVDSALNPINEISDYFTARRYWDRQTGEIKTGPTIQEMITSTVKFCGREMLVATTKPLVTPITGSGKKTNWKNESPAEIKPNLIWQTSTTWKRRKR